MLNTFRIKLWLSLDRLKGSRKIVPLVDPNVDFCTVQVRTVFGYSLELEIVRKCFECRYSNPLFKPRRFITFKVEAKIDGNAPKQVKDAFATSYTFPSLIPDYLPLDEHVDRAINAYLDTVVHNAIQD